MKTPLAFLLFLGAVIVFFGAPEHPFSDWHSFRILAWTLLKVGLLTYSGFQLLEAQQEIDALKHTNEYSERIIAELQNSRPASS
jgi:hypothetical protein